MTALMQQPEPLSFSEAAIMLLTELKLNGGTADYSILGLTPQFEAEYADKLIEILDNHDPLFLENRCR